MQFTTLITDFLNIYPNVFGGDLLRYVLGAGGVYLLINLALARPLAHQKIRQNPLPRGQIRREILASLRTVAIFAATGTTIALGARAGILTIYGEIATYGWAYLIFSITALIVLHDAWFYWSHRALHHPPLFRRFHRLHHRSHQPTPFTSYSFDIGEAVVNALYLPLVLLLLPAHPIALFIFVTHMMLRNALGHCGVEVFPARRDGYPLIGWLSTVTHHDLHHAHAGYNLGLYFTWWDRLMGTEHPEYHARFATHAPHLPRWPRPRTVLLLLAGIVLALLAGRGEAAELHGRYASPGLGVIVEFRPCKPDPSAVCGTVIWLWNAEDTPHARRGEVILFDLRFDNGRWNGRLKSPETGRQFKGTITRRPDQSLALKGCAGPICARQVWQPVETLMKVLNAVR